MLKLNPQSILGPDGVIARRLPAYEHRDEQLAMASAVATLAIERPGHLVVEAGTGVGKVLPILSPPFRPRSPTKKRSLSPPTRSRFQEQLMGKDIPRSCSVMGEEFSAVLVKGRSNYISLPPRCRRSKPSSGSLRTARDRPVARDLGLGQADDGRQPPPLDYRPFPSVWEAVQSEDGNCLGKECPRHAECFFYGARRRAQNANILIVNHALFVTDLALRLAGFGLLPNYEVAIIDEARRLVSVAGEHLGLKLSSLGVDYTLSRLFNERTQRGLLPVHKIDKAIPLVQHAARPRMTSSRRSRTGITASVKASTAGCSTIGYPDTLAETLEEGGHGDRRGGP